MIGKRGTYEAEENFRINDGRQATGAILKICKKNKLSRVAARLLVVYMRGWLLIIPKFMYGSDTLSWNSREKSRITAAEMPIQKSKCIFNFYLI